MHTTQQCARCQRFAEPPLVVGCFLLPNRQKPVEVEGVLCQKCQKEVRRERARASTRKPRVRKPPAKEKPLSIPVRKPAPTWFVRAHPDPSYRIETCVIELASQIYVVARDLWPSLVDEPTFCPKLLVTAVNQQGRLFLWPARAPSQPGAITSWERSGLEAIHVAQDQWVRLRPNSEIRVYELIKAAGKPTDPAWPKKSFQDIVMLAFRDRLIDKADHLVLRRLRGEV